MMTRNLAGKPRHILVADDDEDDCMLVREAFAECRPESVLSFVHDGEQLMDYLLRKPPYGDAHRPLPDLVLLDLNMPCMDGREALCAIKSHAQLKRLPVIVLTTSSACEDIARSYQDGASSFFTKPGSFSELTQLIRLLGDYWLERVSLPPSIGEI